MNSHKDGRARPAWSARKIATRTVGVILTVAVAAVLGAVVIAPAVLGGRALTVLSGSMRPALEPGDIVVVRPLTPSQVCREVKIGDVITFLPYPDDPTLITHRVTSKRVLTAPGGPACEFTTQGDANTSTDTPISPAQVRAKAMYCVPKLGWAQQWAADHRPILVLVAAAIVLATWLRPRRTTTTTTVATPVDLDHALHARVEALENASRRHDPRARSIEIGDPPAPDQPTTPDPAEASCSS